MMPDLFLYQRLDALSEFGGLDKEMPNNITANLNPRFVIRPYQEEAFARFIHCFNKDFQGKHKPLHFLFNMATGSGKTLIMAGLILYLYEKGYRNFLFFVNSNNIIEKTEDNFLSPRASKYLFNKEIYIKGKQIAVTEVENFDNVNQNNINICFTTIQQLHSDMRIETERENALNENNFKDQKIVFLSDEAHHMSAETQSSSQQELIESESWEKTVERIFKSNKDNLLLEFTATHNYEAPEMVEKYLNKVIYRYDLIEFRNDRYSKEIEIVQSGFNLQDRILQAIILNHYKQRVAVKYRIQLKPVVLLKEKEIKRSKKNKADFHKLIDGLTGDQIDRIRSSEVPVVQKAFHFFDENNISSERLARYLKSDFQEKYCVSVNDEDKEEENKALVNTLEDKDNPIRAVFAVHKLNEGWDVLNLFDIVRCYKTRDSRDNKPGKTTMSEAQLIGRGARYFPFTLSKNDADFCESENNDKFRRKFDQTPNHELRVLEELHYHSINNSKYISEIKTALVERGLMDQNIKTRKLKLKAEFKDTSLYKYGVIWLNERKLRDYKNVRSFADLANLSVKQKNHEHTIPTGSGGVSTAMENSEIQDTQNTDGRIVELIGIEENIVQFAIARNSFFKFSSLKRYFPQLPSMHVFMTSKDYLGGLAISFRGDTSQLEKDPSHKLRACCDLLGKIESELREEITEYEGTTNFREERINAIFADKTLKFGPGNSRVKDENHEAEHLVSVEDWFAFNRLYGTSEERAFVRMLKEWITEAEETYNEIYLLRNERHFSLYNFSDGRAFEPDFVLFLREANGKSITYQLFIEPKGQHLMKEDRWKEKFLKKIRTQHQTTILTENSKYRVIGVGYFYNEERENKFKAKFNEALEDARQMPEQAD